MDIKTALSKEKEFLKTAEKLKESDQYLFANLYKSFKTTVKILTDLEKSIKDEGALIEKEYVKGRPALTANPAITHYNSTSKNLALLASKISDLLAKVPEEDGVENDLKSILSRKR